MRGQQVIISFPKDEVKRVAELLAHDLGISLIFARADLVSLPVPPRIKRAERTLIDVVLDDALVKMTATIPDFLDAVAEGHLNARIAQSLATNEEWPIRAHLAGLCKEIVVIPNLAKTTQIREITDTDTMPELRGVSRDLGKLNQLLQERQQTLIKSFLPNWLNGTVGPDNNVTRESLTQGLEIARDITRDIRSQFGILRNRRNPKPDEVYTNHAVNHLCNTLHAMFEVMAVKNNEPLPAHMPGIMLDSSQERLVVSNFNIPSVAESPGGRLLHCFVLLAANLACAIYAKPETPIAQRLHQTFSDYASTTRWNDRNMPRISEDKLPQKIVDCLDFINQRCTEAIPRLDGRQTPSPFYIHQFVPPPIYLH